MPRHLAPASSAALLQLHTQRVITLSLQEFDFHWDNITDLLERANDERFRCTEENTQAVPPTPLSGVDGVLDSAARKTPADGSKAGSS